MMIPPERDDPWQLECLICDGVPEDMFAGSFEAAFNPLVRIQEHGMNEHGFALDDIRRQTREGNRDDGYTWRLPDGTTWLRATQREGGAGDAT